MVSTALESLDRWLALAEAVLAEQPTHIELELESAVSLLEEPVQLSFDLGGASIEKFRPAPLTQSVVVRSALDIDVQRVAQTRHGLSDPNNI